MKTKYFIPVMALLLMSASLFSQEVTSGVKKIMLKTAPELIIEKIVFEDDNYNEYIDAEENFFFELTVKNIGKTAAEHPIIETVLLDTATKGITFKPVTKLEKINAGDVRIIQIFAKADKKIKTGTANFSFTLSDNHKYKTEPKLYDQKMQEKNVFLASEWYYPTSLNMVSEESVVKVRLCVKSMLPLTELKLYQNDELIKTLTSFEKTGGSACTFLMEDEIYLKEGPNELKAFIKNGEKTISSEKRVIIFKPDYTEFRNALVIGNSNYKTAPLKNPQNDAAEIAKTLEKLNFNVTVLIDADKKQIREAVRNFKAQLEKDKGVGLFYYAGHGIQVNGENYLVPLNHDIQEEYDIEDEAVRVNSILSYMQDAGTRMNIVILDACRDNPYARSTRSGTRGLATIYAKGSGSIIAFATSPGSVAQDGDGKNGLYTQELLKAVQTPGMEIGMVFRKVLENVKKNSDGKQIPWTTSSIEGEFYFSK